MRINFQTCLSIQMKLPFKKLNSFGVFSSSLMHERNQIDSVVAGETFWCFDRLLVDRMGTSFWDSGEVSKSYSLQICTLFSHICEQGVYILWHASTYATYIYDDDDDEHSICEGDMYMLRRTGANH